MRACVRAGGQAAGRAGGRAGERAGGRGGGWAGGGAGTGERVGGRGRSVGRSGGRGQLRKMKAAEWTEGLSSSATNVACATMIPLTMRSSVTGQDMAWSQHLRQTGHRGCAVRTDRKKKTPANGLHSADLLTKLVLAFTSTSRSSRAGQSTARCNS